MNKTKQYIILTNYILLTSLLLFFILNWEFIFNCSFNNISNEDKVEILEDKKQVDINSNNNDKKFSNLTIYNNSEEEIEVELKNVEKEEYILFSVSPKDSTALNVQSGEVLLRATKKDSTLYYNATKYYYEGQSYEWDIK